MAFVLLSFVLVQVSLSDCHHDDPLNTDQFFRKIYFFDLAFLRCPSAYHCPITPSKGEYSQQSGDNLRH
jgi:hypothetical protein